MIIMMMASAALRSSCPPCHAMRDPAHCYQQSAMMHRHYIVKLQKKFFHRTAVDYLFSIQQHDPFIDIFAKYGTAKFGAGKII